MSDRKTQSGGCDGEESGKSLATYHKSIGQATYDRIGDAYADVIDTRPYNALYERPATLALVGDVAGRRVLDMGCGHGWYAETLRNKGAAVVGFDASETMLHRAAERLGETVSLHRQSLDEPYAFAKDAEFDLAVAPLCLHYVPDLRPVYAEVARILKPEGAFIFSTHHPANDYPHHPEGDYHETRLVMDFWKGIGEVQFYRRPMQEILDPLFEAGLLLERFVEALPNEAFARQLPESFAQVKRSPAFLCVRARRFSSVPATFR